MLFKTFTGKELLDSSAKNQSKEKKDCHSTVFERLDGKEGGVSCIMESLVHILFLPQLLHMIQMFSSCAASALPPLQGKKICRCFGPVPHKSKRSSATQGCINKH
ncbi:hypothetical protein PVAP13_5KG084661 [Panicum virgatum]|uniref:Uncharacterized protein n=1 Tax=Panicum virgatum TaxID=38727 RepID=A0A8T0SBC8_PANVG|nr:hypothetical protein PVAP13_5KG084661 [Panicum virgatum]